MANNQFNSSIVNSPLILYQVSSDSNSANVIFNKSRGAIVHDGDDLGTLTFYGDSGASTEVGAQIQCIINGTPAVDRMPGEIRFRTRPDIAGAGLLERIKITPQGAMSIATPDLGETGLTVNGGEEVQSGNLLVSGGDITITGGDLHLPATTSATNGVITAGGNRFIHNYGAVSTDGNTFVGINSGNMTTTTQLSTACGGGALASITSGKWCTAVGSGSQTLVTTGSGNCSMGYASLRVATSATSCTALGYQAMRYATTPVACTAVGQEALSNFTTSVNAYHTAIGYRSLYNLLTGTNCIGLGIFSGLAYTTNESNCICIGSQGVIGDSGHIRIGTAATHTRAFVAGITGITPATAGALVNITDSAGQVGTITNGTATWVLTSNGVAANPSFQALPAAPPGYLTYAEETGANKTIVINYEYGANRGGGVAFALPATAAVGTRFAITGIAGLWNITQGASQVVRFGSTTTSAGAGTKVVATDAGDSITCTCIVADTVWRITNSVGNITIS